eukprot:Hpha_TRINITY_DN27044_c0_g1::TRINITY_DN27044_c0_g1_i1::g.33266::m.33266
MVLEAAGHIKEKGVVVTVVISLVQEPPNRLGRTRPRPGGGHERAQRPGSVESYLHPPPALIHVPGGPARDAVEVLHYRRVCAGVGYVCQGSEGGGEIFREFRVGLLEQSRGGGDVGALFDPRVNSGVVVSVLRVVGNKPEARRGTRFVEGGVGVVLVVGEEPRLRHPPSVLGDLHQQPVEGHKRRVLRITCSAVQARLALPRRLAELRVFEGVARDPVQPSVADLLGYHREQRLDLFAVSHVEERLERRRLNIRFGESFPESFHVHLHILDGGGAGVVAGPSAGEGHSVGEDEGVLVVPVPSLVGQHHLRPRRLVPPDAQRGNVRLPRRGASPEGKSSYVVPREVGERRPGPPRHVALADGTGGGDVERLRNALPDAEGGLKHTAIGVVGRLAVVGEGLEENVPPLHRRFKCRHHGGVGAVQQRHVVRSGRLRHPGPGGHPRVLTVQVQRRDPRLGHVGVRRFLLPPLLRPGDGAGNKNVEVPVHDVVRERLPLPRVHRPPPGRGGVLSPDDGAELGLPREQVFLERAAACLAARVEVAGEHHMHFLDRHPSRVPYHPHFEALCRGEEQRHGGAAAGRHRYLFLPLLFGHNKVQK